MAKKENYPSKDFNLLLKVVLNLKTKKEAQNFFRDLLTLKEINDLAARFKIARLLWQKKLSYQQIAKRCQVSTTTVTRVAHWLFKGMGGYKKALKNLK